MNQGKQWRSIEMRNVSTIFCGHGGSVQLVDLTVQTGIPVLSLPNPRLVLHVAT